MILSIARRMLTETDPRLLWKLTYNAGFRGMRSVERFKARLARGVVFPPFLYISIINSCQLRCQGCWVDVAAPRTAIPLGELNRIIKQAKRRGNSVFGLLGGEPFLHPNMFDVLATNPGCYFQLLTNGHLITASAARRLRRLGNASPLISIEGTEVVSDERRGSNRVFERTLRGLENCRRHKLITGVATSVCQSNIDDLVSEAWLLRLIELGVHYVWFHTYRVVGPSPSPELALRPDQVARIRRFIVEMRAKLPIVIIDAYWDGEGQAVCPMAMGISHHIGPSGAIEPCPIIQLARESIHDGDLYATIRDSAFLDDCRKAAARVTRGCVVMERPDVLRDLAIEHGARDTTHRGTSLAELEHGTPRTSQHLPNEQLPEVHWAYRFAKKYWFFGFGAYE